MKIIKYLGSLVLVTILLFLFIANFSSVESGFKCSGEISFQGSSQPIIIYIKLEKYRWWVEFWSDSNGSLKLEIPNKTYEYYERIEEVGDQLQIHGYQKDMKGNFSMLSKTLAINTSYGFFDGTCKKTEL